MQKRTEGGQRRCGGDGTHQTVIGVAITCTPEDPPVPPVLSPEESKEEEKRLATIDDIKINGIALEHTLSFEKSDLARFQQVGLEAAAKFALNEEPCQVAFEQELARATADRYRTTKERAKVVKTKARAQVNECERALHVASSRAALTKSIAAGGLRAIKTLRTAFSLSDEQILHEINPPPSKVWCAWPKP